MTFQKIPKEEWLKMSQEEKDYHTLEFKESIEKRQRLMIIATRTIAIFFILGLFYIGYAQIEQARLIDSKVKEYGQYGYCALCGEYNMKKCECQYVKKYYAGNILVDDGTNTTKLKQELADYNSKSCLSWDDYTKQKEKEALDELES
jgi:hypothetical protein